MIPNETWGKALRRVAVGLVFLLAINLSACGQKEEVEALTVKAAAPVPETAAPAAPDEPTPVPTPETTTPTQSHKPIEEVEAITEKAAAPAPETAAPAAPDEPTPVPTPETTTPTQSHKPIGSNLESYSVTVAANDQLTIPGPPGELRVWIGITSKAPRIQERMSTETRELEAVGETARVKPFALGIDVDPKESICEKIDPTGSEVRFRLIPIKTGVFKVGANVEFYNSNNCSGTPVPKSAESVEVTVTVDEKGVISDSTEELIVAAWKAFLQFWDKLLLLVFALLLFIIRRKLYRLFGFKEK